MAVVPINTDVLGALPQPTEPNDASMLIPAPLRVEVNDLLLLATEEKLDWWLLTLDPWLLTLLKLDPWLLKLSLCVARDRERGTAIRCCCSTAACPRSPGSDIVGGKPDNR